MTARRQAARHRDPIVRLSDFKANAARLLPHGHPLLRILERTPDAMSAGELDLRLTDWLVLLEE
jgi:hypothetical protein